MSSSKHKFNENLIKLSQSNVLDEAKKEWLFIYDEKRKKQDVLCVCQHKVKNANYMYNIKTKHTIIVGSTCHKKFNLGYKKIHKYLSKIFKYHLEKGEYKIIDNLIVYSQSIQRELKKKLKNEINNNYNINKLNELLDDITFLINNYEIKYLSVIYNLCLNKIKKLKLDELKERKNREEIERKNREEKERKNREEIERLKEENICTCNSKYKYICKNCRNKQYMSLWKKNGYIFGVK